jgi:hypothetical protein
MALMGLPSTIHGIECNLFSANHCGSDELLGGPAFLDLSVLSISPTCAFYGNLETLGAIDLPFRTPEELIPGLLGLSGIQAFPPVFGV